MNHHILSFHSTLFNMTHRAMIPKFYVFEGLDGSGKTTMVQHASNYLTKHNVPNQIVQASPKDEESLFLRQLCIEKKVPPIAILALMTEMRLRVLLKQVIPALAAGKIVLADRWNASTFAYQVAGMKLSRSLYHANQHYFNSYPNLFKDDIDISLINHYVNDYYMVYLGITPELSMERVEARSEHKDQIEQSGIEFFTDVHNGFLEAITDHISGGHAAKIIPADQPIEEVYQDIEDLFRIHTK